MKRSINSVSRVRAFSLAAGCALWAGVGAWAQSPLRLSTEQITFGPQHHFFGYIGQSLTIPWNASGRYILALRSDFHDHLPEPNQPAGIVLIDTANDYAVMPVEQTRAWNFQQGTMFYWNPAAPETQFFFNDRDRGDNRVFTVLYDIQRRRRLREYRFEGTPVANGGVAPTGAAFAAINYGRLARLRPVTGYVGAYDWTGGVRAPDDDGIFLVNPGSGAKRLLASFARLGQAARSHDGDVVDAHLYINHTLWNRSADRLYFYLRGRRDEDPMAVNLPCTIRADGSELTVHDTYIGGHPEWYDGDRIIGRYDNRQVFYNVATQDVSAPIASAEILAKPGGDIALSPDTALLVNGHATGAGAIYHTVFRFADQAYGRSTPLDRGPYQKGPLRIDPAPRWNRTGTALLVSAWTENDTRQLFIVRLNQTR